MSESIVNNGGQGSLSYYDELAAIPAALQNIPFFLTWASQLDLTDKKAEAMLKSVNTKASMETTRDYMRRATHCGARSFYLWYLRKKYPRYVGGAKAEIDKAFDLLKKWGHEEKAGTLVTFSNYSDDYIDGVTYVITAMKALLDPNAFEDYCYLLEKENISGLMMAGILHVEQEFFRVSAFTEEIDHRIIVLESIRRLNPRDSRACLYLAKTLGEKRKNDLYTSIPSKKEMDLLVQGYSISEGDNSIVTELCFCLAQLLRNAKATMKIFPLSLGNNSMQFGNKSDVAAFINNKTGTFFKDLHTAAPLCVKLAEIHSSLLPEGLRHPTIAPLSLVNRALEAFPKYSKALHRKAKILFQLCKTERSHKRFEDGMRCLELAFEYEETNADALCDYIFRLMRNPDNQKKLLKIFQEYCNERGETLWGKRKVGSLYYLYGCYLWIIKDKANAIWCWMNAEERNPNAAFYFENLYKHKTNYKWHQSELLTIERIIYYLEHNYRFKEEEIQSRDCLLTRLRSIYMQ